MFTAAFWKDAAERAAKTFGQAAIAVLTAGATGVMDADWGKTFSVGALAAVVSVLTSLISSGVGDEGTASLVSKERR